MDTFVKQSSHRQEMEKQVIKSGSFESKLGLVFALVISLAGIGGGIFLTMNGHDRAGMVLFGGTLVSLVGSFIYGSRQRRLERESKYIA